MVKLIKGQDFADRVEQQIKEGLKDLGNVTLAVILIGNNPASEIYVKKKCEACERVGIFFRKYTLEASTPQEKLLELINELNQDKEVNGIIVQLPLPPNFDQQAIRESVHPKKDVDGLNPLNFGRVVQGNENIVPATPKGVMKILDEENISLEGKNVVIVGRSNIVGKPLAFLALQRNATVTICHSKTKDLKEHTLKADVLISATGVIGLIKEDMVKKDAIVIDIGTTKKEGKLHGDVDFDKVKEKAKIITPVPRGVGPMTIAMLLENVLIVTKNQLNTSALKNGEYPV